MPNGASLSQESQLVKSIFSISEQGCQLLHVRREVLVNFDSGIVVDLWVAGLNK